MFTSAHVCLGTCTCTRMCAHTRHIEHTHHLTTHRNELEKEKEPVTKTLLVGMSHARPAASGFVRERQPCIGGPATGHSGNVA